MAGLDTASLASLRSGFVGAGRLGKALAWRAAEGLQVVVVVTSHSDASA